MGQERLVVVDEGIRFPLALAPTLMRGPSGLERGRPIHLTGHEQGAVQKVGRGAFLDHLESGVLDAGPAGVGRSKPPAGPIIRRRFQKSG